MLQSPLIHPFWRRGAILAALYWEGLMAREVQVGNTTFIVHSFSRDDATETAEQILKRAILQNAEREFRSGFVSGKNESTYDREMT